MKPRTAGRAAEERAYRELCARYLSEHPVCQVWIAERGLVEAEVVSQFTAGAEWFAGERIPAASQIHHRNKRRKGRLIDERFIMAVSRHWHDEVENRKGWARDRGYLLPMQADENGCWGDGNRALPTPELIAANAGRNAPPAMPV